MTVSRPFMICHVISSVKGGVVFTETTACQLDKYPVSKQTAGVIEIRPRVTKSLWLNNDMNKHALVVYLQLSHKKQDNNFKVWPNHSKSLLCQKQSVIPSENVLQSLVLHWCNVTM